MPDGKLSQQQQIQQISYGMRQRNPGLKALETLLKDSVSRENVSAFAQWMGKAPESVKTGFQELFALLSGKPGPGERRRAASETWRSSHGVNPTYMNPPALKSATSELTPGAWRQTDTRSRGMLR